MYRAYNSNHYLTDIATFERITTKIFSSKCVGKSDHALKGQKMYIQNLFGPIPPSCAEKKWSGNETARNWSSSVHQA